MNAATATVSDRAAQPVLTRAWTRASATLNAFVCLVTLVFNLVALGKNLAFTVRGHVRGPGDGLTGRFVAARGISVIGTCMRRGAMRGAALYEVLRRQANRGLSVRLRWLRRDRTPPGQGGAHARAGAAAQDTAPAKPVRPKSWQTGDIFYQPGETGAADAARRRTACAIPADNCLDPGMIADYAGKFPDKLLLPIGRFGGCLTQSIAEVDRCKAPASRIETPRFERAPEHRRPNCLSAAEQLRDPPPPQAKSAARSSPEAEPRAASGETRERTETVPAMQWPVLPHPAREVAATALP